MRYLPRPSMTVAFAGAFREAPTWVIRPFSTMTVWFDNTSSRSIGMTETPVKTIVEPCAAVFVGAARPGSVDATRAIVNTRDITLSIKRDRAERYRPRRGKARDVGYSVSQVHCAFVAGDEHDGPVQFASPRPTRPTSLTLPA